MKYVSYITIKEMTEQETVDVVRLTKLFQEHILIAVALTVKCHYQMG